MTINEEVAWIHDEFFSSFSEKFEGCHLVYWEDCVDLFYPKYDFQKVKEKLSEINGLCIDLQIHGWDQFQLYDQELWYTKDQNKIKVFFKTKEYKKSKVDEKVFEEKKVKYEVKIDEN